MFGLLKKKITPFELGGLVEEATREFIAADCGRSLGTCFENFDGSKGWVKFLEQNSVPLSFQRLYFFTYQHCVIQATCTQFDEVARRFIVREAMNASYPREPVAYEFGTTYGNLELVHCGRWPFDLEVASLNNIRASLSFLPNPQVGVSTAKYLIERVIIPNMANSSRVLQNFELYSGTVSASIATVQRALNHISASFKITGVDRA